MHKVSPHVLGSDGRTRRQECRTTSQLSRRILASVATAIVLSLAPLPAWSQSEAASGQLRGAVVEENGASVAGAKGA